MTNYRPLEVRVWGSFACFTRPEMKVERVSYDVMTASAARAILKAIFWKPEFDWEVREIDVLKPIRRMSIVRNEVNRKLVASSVKKWANTDDPAEAHYYADQDRTQRHALILRDVAYVIRADIVLQDHVNAHPAKYRDQFRRRVSRGQCFRRPYLGCREFSAYFGEPRPDEHPVDVTTALGRTLFDLAYDDQGNGEPIFFNASLADGTLTIPPELYAQRYRRRS